MTTGSAEPRLFDVAVVGVANVDLVTRVPCLPDEGETAFGTELEARPGGKGLNQAVAVARMGGRSALIAKAGDDAWGRMLRRTLISNGVDASTFMLVPGGVTAAVFVQVPASGDSAVTVTRTATTLHTLDDIRRARPLLHGAAVVVVQLELDTHVVEAALTGTSGTRIGTLAPLRPLPPSILGLLDIIVVNASEARQVLGEVADAPVDGRRLAQSLVRLGPRAAVVTLGASGAAYADKVSVGIVPAQAVDVDETTGAGDAFLGTLALLQARGASLADAVTAATEAGTIVVAGAGQRGREHALTRLTVPTAHVIGGVSRQPGCGCQAVGVTRRVDGQWASGAGPGVPGPDRWRAAEQRRRKLAERLARDLAHPDPQAPPGALSDFVSGTMVRVRWTSAIDAQIAFDQAPSLIAFGGEYRRVQGRGGVVLVVHCGEGSMDDWSLVVPYEPFAAPVLVCLDDMGEHCMGVYGDSAEARDALSTLHVRVLGAFDNRQRAIARGSLPPDA